MRWCVLLTSETVVSAKLLRCRNSHFSSLHMQIASHFMLKLFILYSTRVPAKHLIQTLPPLDTDVASFFRFARLSAPSWFRIPGSISVISESTKQRQPNRSTIGLVTNKQQVVLQPTHRVTRPTLTSPPPQKKLPKHQGAHFCPAIFFPKLV